MIIINHNVFNPRECTRHEYDGKLIDFLLQKYPNGFESQRSAIYVNSQKLSVEDYDIDVTCQDIVVVIPDIPAAGLSASTIIQIVAAVISIALQILLAPKLPKNRSSKGRVFEIGSGQNIPALGNPITEHFGKLWFYPDVASQPYVFYQNNDQYVYQILLIGSGYYEINDIMLGNTPLNIQSAENVEYRVFGPDDHNSQYGVINSEFGIWEDVVTSVDVQGINFARNANDSTTGKNYTTYFEGDAYPTGFSVGDVVASFSKYSEPVHEGTVTYISGKKLGTTIRAEHDDWYQITHNDLGWRGWFVVCGVGKQTERIDVDIEFPQGVYARNADGETIGARVYFTFQYQAIDEAGNDIGSVIELDVFVSMKSENPVRRTYTKTVPLGRYKVRARRLTKDENSPSLWKGLKAYIVNTVGQYAYGPVTLIAFKLKASEALSSSSDKIRVLATRILPTIESDFTLTAPTVNPVDSFCQIVRTSDPVGLDVPALKILATRWANTNGFNWRFDEQITVYEALQMLAYGHRSQPQAYAKLLSMRPDDERPFDQYLITQEHMVKDSYSVGVNIGPQGVQIDGYRLSYQDPYSTTTLYVVFPAGAIAPEDSPLNGCTDEATAIEQAKYLWAKQNSVRRVVDFTTEWDSLAYNVGDRVSVVSNIIDQVRTCRVISQNGDKLTVDAYLEAPQLHVRIRDEYGQPSDIIEASMTGNQLSLTALPPFPIYGIDAAQESTSVVLGTVVSLSKSYIINSITPGQTSVQVTGYSYSPGPYLYPIPGEVIA